ncbi:MAG: hypothetical protein PVH85_14680, partial [Desulfobacterales bacterium]
MIRRFGLIGILLFMGVAWFVAGPAVYAAESIVIGVPTSLGFLEGKEAHKSVQMAASEINSKGGVNVAGTKMKLKVVATDLR